MAEEGKGESEAAAAPSAVPVAVPSAASAAAVEELPRAIVRRVVKDKLAELSSRGGGEEDINVQKDALLAFAESARIFIHYLSATANDICKESKRQTINAEDVIKALEEIEFPEFIEPLRISLEDFRRKNAAKRSAVKAKETDRKRKLEQELPAQNGHDGIEGDAEEERKDEGNDSEDDE